MTRCKHCDLPTFCRGMCQKHYRRWYRGLRGFKIDDGDYVKHCASCGEHGHNIRSCPSDPFKGQETPA